MFLRIPAHVADGVDVSEDPETGGDDGEEEAERLDIEGQFDARKDVEED